LHPRHQFRRHGGIEGAASDREVEIETIGPLKVPNGSRDGDGIFLDLQVQPTNGQVAKFPVGGEIDRGGAL